MNKKGNGQDRPPMVDYPNRGIISTQEPIATGSGEYKAFFASSWIRMIAPNGLADSWAVVQDQGGKKIVVLMIPIHLITGFTAANHPGGEDVFDADTITLIEIA